MSLLQGAAPGTDIVLTEERMVSARAFANKIWNAARFLGLKMEASGVEPKIPDGPALEGAALEDRWMFSRLNTCAGQLNKSIDTYRYHEVAQTLWHFFWHEFCDWYVEMKKLRLTEGSGMTADWRNILAAFETALRMLHPAMPFVTEELWQRLAKGSEGQPASIARAGFPQPQTGWTDDAAEKEMALLQEIIVSARNLRSQMKIEPKEVLGATLHATGAARRVATENSEALEKLARVSLTVSEAAAPSAGVVKKSTPEFDLVLDVAVEKIEAARQDMEKDVAQLEKLVNSTTKQLSNENYVQRAPAHVVEESRTKLAEYEAKLAKSREALAGLG
jgi:valyl-tRNA synthetase